MQWFACTVHRFKMIEIQNWKCCSVTSALMKESTTIFYTAIYYYYFFDKRLNYVMVDAKKYGTANIVEWPNKIKRNGTIQDLL